MPSMSPAMSAVAWCSKISCGVRAMSPPDPDGPGSIPRGPGGEQAYARAAGATTSASGRRGGQGGEQPVEQRHLTADQLRAGLVDRHPGGPVDLGELLEPAGVRGPNE